RSRDEQQGRTTPNLDLINRLAEAVEQVDRRHNYSRIVVNPWGDEGFKDACEEFVREIFLRVLSELKHEYIALTSKPLVEDTITAVTKILQEERPAIEKEFIGNILREHNHITPKNVLPERRQIRLAEQVSIIYDLLNYYRANPKRIVLIHNPYEIEGQVSDKIEDVTEFIIITEETVGVLANEVSMIASLNGFIDEDWTYRPRSIADKEAIVLVFEVHKDKRGGGRFNVHRITNEYLIDPDARVFIVERDAKGKAHLKMETDVIHTAQFEQLAAYFDNDTKMTLNQLERWQEEYRELLKQEISLTELLEKELFLVTDEEGNYTGEIRPRELCHADGTWHRGVFMILVDKEGRILVQVRADSKKHFPGCRDASASGHLGLIKEYIDGAINETEEEVFDSQINLDRSKIERIGSDGELTTIHEVSESGLKDHERTSLYVYFVTDEEKTLIKRQESEVKDLQWVDLDEEIERWQNWKKDPQGSKKLGIDYAALGIDILSNSAIVSKIRIIINDVLEEERGAPDSARSKSGLPLTPEQVVQEISQKQIRNLAKSEYDTLLESAEQVKQFLEVTNRTNWIPRLEELLADLGHLRAGPFDLFFGAVYEGILYLDESILNNPAELALTTLHELGTLHGLTHNQNLELENEFIRIAAVAYSQWEKWISLNVSIENLNLDMFRDYDYRSTGPVVKPEVIFRFGLVWAAMALEKAGIAGITDNRRVVLARDARRIEPELVEALVAALRYTGLDVIYVSAGGPNAVTSYSWAVQEHKPLMSIFITASHVSRPKEVIVRGFKVAMLAKKDGSLQSMTTREIKEASKASIIELIEHPEKMREIESAQKGRFIASDIVENCVRMNVLVGEIATQEGSLYDLAREIEASDFPVNVLSDWENRVGLSRPLRGIKIAVEGANTPSGQLTANTFSRLGAEVILINGDIHEIEGEHRADPSKEENLTQLKATIAKENADFGIAFDLDGDRGAIVVPEKSLIESEITFHTLAPDNLQVVLLPYLIENLGYNPEAINKRLGVIRDVLGTYGVDDITQRLGIETFQTDAGYVFLKAKRKELQEAEGYVIPIYGERSGHCWLDVTGEIENPLAVAVLFATMVKKAKYVNDKTEVMNPFFETYQEKSVPYLQSPRFQPAFHPVLLSRLSSDPRNDSGWRYDPQKPTNPPQAVIALGKDTGIRALQEEFQVGKTYDTPAGKLRVGAFNTYHDSVEEGGLFRFADIVFELNDRFAGRFVFRASSNDPTFVCSYETPIMENERIDSSSAQHRKLSIGGVVLDWLEQKGYALVTKANIQKQLNLSEEDADKRSKNLNLESVGKEVEEYLRMNEIRNNLLESAGKQTKEEISESNLYREIGFEGNHARLGWVIPPAWEDIQNNLELFLEIAKGKEYFIFIGMGGSINTVKALIEILDEQSKYKVFAYDQLDPTALDEINSQIDDWEKVLVISISKSATTKETHVLSNNLREIFENIGLNYRNHYLWLIDEGGETKLAERGWEGVSSLPIQPDKHTDIGGRFTAPHTLIFFLPLVILLGKDIAIIESLYTEYLEKIDTLRQLAASEAERLARDKTQYFGIRVKPELQSALLTWISQLFQESLGSKIYGFNPKTLVVSSPEELPNFFTSIDAPSSENNVLAMMQATYFLQIIVALLSYSYAINFVTQEQVEIYKRKMRELEAAEIPQAEEVSLPELIKAIQNRLIEKHKFIEVVFYAQRSQEYINLLQDYLQQHLSQRVLVFIGSDWNHHSYQAAYNNQDTLFVILTQKEFLNHIQGVKPETLEQNIKDLRIITYATYETLKDKALYLALRSDDAQKYPLLVAKQAHQRAVAKYGTRRISRANARFVEGKYYLYLTLQEAKLYDNWQEVLEDYLTRFAQLVRAPPEFNIEITTDTRRLSIDPTTELPYISACAQSSNTIFIHPYFFSLPFVIQQDILRHEFSELETGSHTIACQISYDYFKANPKELNTFLKAIKDRGVKLDQDYLLLLKKILSAAIPASAHAGIYIINGGFQLAIVTGDKIDSEFINTEGRSFIKEIPEKLDEYMQTNNVKIVSAILSGGESWEVQVLAARLWLEMDVLCQIRPAVGTSAAEIAQQSVGDAISRFIKIGILDVPRVSVDPRTGEVYVTQLVTLEDYRKITPKEDWYLVMDLVHRFRNKKLFFFSSTPRGGGVALMRHSLIRFLQLLGVDAHWYVMEADPAIFEITKGKVHNVLQAVAYVELKELTYEDKDNFTQWSIKNVGRFKDVVGGADVIVIDDPQPSGMAHYIKELNSRVKIIYRSHIQLQRHLIAMANTMQHHTWNFIWDNIKDYIDIFVSHPSRSFVPDSVLQEKVVFMPATSDPLDGLNKPLTEQQIQYYLQLFNEVLRSNQQEPLDLTRPYIIQIARFDPSKGIPDVLEAYRILREKFKNEGYKDRHTPQLVIVGNGAIDDPEGEPIYHDTLERLQRDEYRNITNDIKVARLNHVDQILNALLRSSHIGLQLSFAEGFEVKPSEGLDKEIPFIVYQTGCLPLQIQDGKSGYVVAVGDTKQVAEHLYNLLTEQNLYRKMSGNAKKLVRKDVWTVPNAINWLFLATELTEKDKVIGDGRSVRELVEQHFSPTTTQDTHSITAQDIYDIAQDYPELAIGSKGATRLADILFEIAIVKYLIETGKLTGPPSREEFVELLTQKLSAEDRQAILTYQITTNTTWDDAAKQEATTILQNLGYDQETINWAIRHIDLHEAVKALPGESAEQTHNRAIQTQVEEFKRGIVAFRYINVILHRAMAGMGDFAFMLNISRRLKIMYPDKKIRAIFHSPEDFSKLPLLDYRIHPEKELQEIEGIEFVNPGEQWRDWEADYIGAEDIAIVYAVYSNEDQLRKARYRIGGESAGVRLFIHEFAVELPWSGINKTIGGTTTEWDIPLNLSEDSLGLPPLAPEFQDEVKRLGDLNERGIRKERESILRTIGIDEKYLSVISSSNWGFSYIHSEPLVNQYFEAIEQARINPGFAGRDLTIFFAFGFDKVKEAIEKTAQNSNYSLFNYDGNKSVLIQEGKTNVTIVELTKVPRYIFQRLFILSDGIPLYITGADNLTNAVYLNAFAKKGQPFIWDSLIFQDTFGLTKSITEFIDTHSENEFIQRAIVSPYDIEKLVEMILHVERYRATFKTLGDGLRNKFDFENRLKMIIEDAWKEYENKRKSYSKPKRVPNLRPDLGAAARDFNKQIRQLIEAEPELAKLNPEELIEAIMQRLGLLDEEREELTTALETYLAEYILNKLNNEYLKIEGKHTSRSTNSKRDKEIVEEIRNMGTIGIRSLINIIWREKQAWVRAKAVLILGQLYRDEYKDITLALVERMLIDESILVRSIIARKVIPEIKKQVSDSEAKNIIEGEIERVDLSPWQRQDALQVLDVGCQFGEASHGMAAYFRKQGYVDVIVVGVDQDYSALIEAERNRTDDGVVFIYGDVDTDMFGPADIVISMNLLLYRGIELRQHAESLVRQANTDGGMIYFAPSIWNSYYDSSGPDAYMRLIDMDYRLKELLPQANLKRFDYSEPFGEGSDRGTFGSPWGVSSGWIVATLPSKITIETEKGIVRIKAMRFPDREWNLRILNPDVLKDAQVTFTCSIDSPDDIVEIVFLAEMLRYYGASNIQFVTEKLRDINNGLEIMLRYHFDGMAYRDERGIVVPYEVGGLGMRGKKSPPIWTHRVLYQHKRLRADAKDAADAINAISQRIKVSKESRNPIDWKITLPKNLEGQNIVLLHSTENNLDIVELWLMLVALRQARVGSISLILTYAGYSRQDKIFKPGQGISALAMLKAIDALVDNYFALNVHYGKQSGLVQLDSYPYKLYNLNAFVQVAEDLFEWLVNQINRSLVEELGEHPLIVIAPDDGAFMYVREATLLLEDYIRENYGITINISCGYMDKKRKSPTEVEIPPYILDENNQKITKVNGKDIKDCWVFIIDDETSSGGTLLAATYVLVRKMYLSWVRILTGVVHGKLVRGLDPFRTGHTYREITAAISSGRDIKPRPRYIDESRELMPPRLFITTKSVALPKSLRGKQRVSIGPLISHVVKDIIGFRGPTRELVNVIVDNIRSRVNEPGREVKIEEELAPQYIEIIEGNRNNEDFLELMQEALEDLYRDSAIQSDEVVCDFVLMLHNIVSFALAQLLASDSSSDSEGKTNTYPLSVSEQAQKQAEQRFGKYRILTDITEIDTFNLVYPEQFLENQYNVLKQRLAQLRQLSPRAPPRWRLVITTDLSLTQGCVAAVNLGQLISQDYPENTVFIHPYLFSLPEAKQLEILYHELISHIYKGITNENEAMRDTNAFMWLDSSTPYRLADLREVANHKHFPWPIEKLSQDGRKPIEASRDKILKDLYYRMFEIIGYRAGYSEKTEHAIGIGIINEEAHCIFGSCMRWLLYGTVPEKQHIEESLRFLLTNLKEYSRPLYLERHLDDNSEYAREAKQNLVANSIRIVNEAGKIATILEDNKAKLAKADLDRVLVDLAYHANAAILEIARILSINPEADVLNSKSLRREIDILEFKVKSLISMTRTYPLTVPEEARNQAEQRWGKDRILTNIEVEGIDLQNDLERFVNDDYEILKQRLAQLRQLSPRAPPRWRLVITTDLSLTQG
ncbi:MAG: glycosyltransferase, partial [Candidatus Omnitrophota bacterium]